MKKIILILLLLFNLISFSNACHDGGDYAGDSSSSYDTSVSIPDGGNYVDGVTNPDLSGLGTNSINIDSTTPTTPEVPAGLEGDTQMQAIMDVIKKASNGIPGGNGIQQTVGGGNSGVSQSELKMACEGNDQVVQALRKLAKESNGKIKDPCDSLQ